MKPSEVLERAREEGISHVTSNDAGEYTCHQCGHTWQRRDRRVLWPISFAWRGDDAFMRDHTLFSIWRWQVGWDGIEQRVYGWSVRAWRLIVKFGEVSR